MHIVVVVTQYVYCALNSDTTLHYSTLPLTLNERRGKAYDHGEHLHRTKRLTSPSVVVATERGLDQLVRIGRKASSTAQKLEQ